MKAFSLLFFVMTISFSAIGAKVDPTATLEKLKKINLTGMRLIEIQTKQDALLYKIVAAKMVTTDMEKIISENYIGRRISNLFVLGEPSAFKNILVYIGEDGDSKKLEFVTIFVNDDSAFIVDYDIDKVEATKLLVSNGPKGEEERYQIVARELFKK